MGTKTRFFGRVTLCAILIALGSQETLRPSARPERFASRAAFECPPTGAYGDLPDAGLPPPEGEPEPPSGEIESVEQADSTSEGVDELSKLVQTSDVIRRKYKVKKYDCEDFARDLQKFLEKKGYKGKTRLVIIYKSDPATGKYLRGESHAVVGVFVGEKMVFLNGQGGRIQDLDQDKDGKVEYVTSHRGPPTDGLWRIELYRNFDAAKDAGVKMD